MSRISFVAAGAVMLLSSMAAYAAAPAVVNQIHRAFSTREIHVARGETIKFSNIDEFLHQIYIESASFNYSSNEQPPGQSIDVVFTTRGTFDVRCQIHPKMVMSVIVD